MALSRPALIWGVSKVGTAAIMWVSPPTVANTAGGPPLKGMCTAKVPLKALMYSMHRWEELPLPTDAKLYLPGLDRNRASNSCKLLAGKLALTAIKLGCEVVNTTGVKSRKGAYGKRGYRCGAKAKGPLNDMTQVWPSGADCATSAVPAVPPTWGLFSITMGVPN